MVTFILTGVLLIGLILTSSYLLFSKEFFTIASTKSNVKVSKSNKLGKDFFHRVAEISTRVKLNRRYA